MPAHDATLEKTLFIGRSVGEPTPLPYYGLIAHHTAIRDAIADAVHIEHTMEPDLKSLVAMQSFMYAFNAYKALGHLLPELFHESGAVILRQLWEVTLNLHWIECDPDKRAQDFCGFTLMENRKLMVKSGSGDKVADFDSSTATYQARFRFVDRRGKEQVQSDFAGRSVADRAIELLIRS